MGDATTLPSGQDSTAGTGQEPTQASGQAPEAAQTLAEVQAALSAARREAAANRTKLSQFEREQQEREQASLTEAQRTARERDALKAELEAARLEARDKVNRYEVQLAASRLGIVDPEAAVKLLDWDAIEYAEDGSPKQIERALKDLIARKPYLAAGQQQSAPQPGSTNPAAGRGHGELTLADVKRMTPAQINANWARVQRAMANGR